MVVPANSHSRTEILINEFIAILRLERANISHHTMTVSLNIWLALWGVHPITTIRFLILLNSQEPSLAGDWDHRLRLGMNRPPQITRHQINHHGCQHQNNDGPEAPFAMCASPVRPMAWNVSIHSFGTCHFQLRISGKSWPFLSMYCLCSISLSLSCCFR